MKVYSWSNDESILLVFFLLLHFFRHSITYSRISCLTFRFKPYAIELARPVSERNKT